MNKNTTIAIIVVIILILVGGYLYSKNTKTVSEGPDTTPEVTTEDDVTATGGATVTTSTTTTTVGVTVAPVKEFTIEGTNFKFSQSNLSVKKGDKVKITFINKEGIHDFKIDEFGVATKMLKAGEKETVEFTATKTGTFEFYCSVGSHRAMGMKGTVVVGA